jgi:hypothetical protein
MRGERECHISAGGGSQQVSSSAKADEYAAAVLIEPCRMEKFWIASLRSQ